jgi:hypothetical protein
MSRVRRLYNTGFGLSTGFIGSQYSTLNYSVYFATHNSWVSPLDSLTHPTQSSILQPLVQPTLMASLANTHSLIHSLRVSLDYFTNSSEYLARAQDLLQTQLTSLALLWRLPNSELTDLRQFRCLIEIYSLGTDCREDTFSEQTLRNVHCSVSSRYQVTSTPQAYGIHVTIIWR